MRGYNPYFESSNRPLGKRSIRFSKTEIQHIALAVVALTIGFALLGPRELSMGDRVLRMFTDPVLLIASFLAVSSGFVFHELAHKFVAIRYGCLAEFRAQMSSLGLAVVIALVANFLFAAPGAVQIYGRVDQKENGIISIAGPATNIAMAVLSLPFVLITTGIAEHILGTIATVNALLGAFNLLPFGPLDGKKVMAWNAPLWGAALAVSIALFIGALLAPSLAL